MAIKRTGQQADFHFQIDGGPVEKLKVARFEGMEAISRPYWFRLELASLDSEIIPDRQEFRRRGQFQEGRVRSLGRVMIEDAVGVNVNHG